MRDHDLPQRVIDKLAGHPLLRFPCESEDGTFERARPRRP